MNNHVITMTGMRSIIKEIYQGLFRLLGRKTGGHGEGLIGKWKGERSVWIAADKRLTK